MRKKIMKKKIRKTFNIASFYFVSALTVISALVLTGKNLNAYSSPAPSSFYKKPNSSVTKIITINQDYKNEGSIDVLSADVYLAKADIALEKEIEEAIFAFTPSGLPCDGPISSPFGMRSDPMTGKAKVHKGVDIAVVTGTPVYSTANGVVVEARNSSSFGKIVKLRHSGGFTTTYAHNSKIAVTEGDYVLKGDIIAYSGNTGYSTGPHLHYEIRKDDEAINPFNQN